MATFIGTEDEFNIFIGPRMRNKVQSLTKKAKNVANNICQHCENSFAELEAAHVHGRERRDIIRSVLEEYRDGDFFNVDLQEFEQKFVNAHYPIEETFLFLCRDCHAKYDAPVERAPKTATKPRNITQPGATSSARRSGALPITIFPSDKRDFAKRFMETGYAVIRTTYFDGSQKEQGWYKKGFSQTSDVITNLRSRPEFRQGKWQSAGIKEVFAYIPDETGS